MNRIQNPVTGLDHNLLPEVKSVKAPQALLFVGNSFFFFNNGAHRYVRNILKNAPIPPKYRGNMVAINGSSLSWHDLESYFRPHAISSYSFSQDGENRVIFRDPSEQLWDAVILHDSSQGPIHPTLGKDFVEFAKLDAEICRKHHAEPIFIASWCYQDKPEMTAQLADAVIKVANENHAIVIPAGLAFSEAHRRDPELNLYIGDKRHPKPAGTYLLALTIVETLFGIDVRKVTNAFDIDPELAFYLREVAHDTVTKFFSRS